MVRSIDGFTSSSNVASLLYSLAYLRAPPPPNAIDKCIQTLGTSGQELAAVSGDDLANVAMALATFQYQPRWVSGRVQGVWCL